MMNARRLLLLIFSVTLFVADVTAQEKTEKHALCFQLSISPMSATIPNSTSSKSFYFAELGAYKREQHGAIFSQYGFLYSNGFFNRSNRPSVDNIQIYRAVGPVLGFGYQPEDLIAGFDMSGGIGLPLRSSDVHEASFSFSVKGFLSMSSHAQFFVRFSNTTTIFSRPQSIRQGGFGIQVLID